MNKILLKIINNILENNNNEKIENIDDNTSLRNDIGFDSLDLAELTVCVEKEFKVDIFEDGLVDTIGEIKQKIKDRNG